MTRLHVIKRKVNQLGIRVEPEAGGGWFWHKPDRNHPNYYQLSDGDTPQFAVGLSTDARFDKAGHLQVEALVTYHAKAPDHQIAETTIFNRGFTGRNQPREQAFINNLHSAYPDQIDEAAEVFFETAARHAPTDG